MTDPIFNVPKWDGQARDVALVWRLTKGRQCAECRLFTNPIGAEIRVEADDEHIEDGATEETAVLQSEAGRDPLALVELAGTWKAQFEEKGWKA